jgi:hypothetical protein
MDTPHVISLLIAPVVMISACGLLCLAFYNRLATIVSRLRVFHAEQLLRREKLETAAPAHHHVRNRMDIVHRQIEEDMARARLIRNTLICLVMCIICMILCSLSLGLSLVAEIMTRVALGVFISGQILMLTGMVFAVLELTRALTPIALEQDFVASRIEAIISSDDDPPK